MKKNFFVPSRGTESRCPNLERCWGHLYWAILAMLTLRFMTNHTLMRFHMSVSVRVCLFACLCVCLHVCPSTSVCVCPHVCLPVCVSVRMSVCVYMCLSACLSVCLFPSAHLSVCISPFVCPHQPVCLSASVCMSIRICRTLKQVHNRYFFVIPIPLLSNYKEDGHKISKTINWDYTSSHWRFANSYQKLTWEQSFALSRYASFCFIDLRHFISNALKIANFICQCLFMWFIAVAKEILQLRLIFFKNPESVPN